MSARVVFAVQGVAIATRMVSPCDSMSLARSLWVRRASLTSSTCGSSAHGGCVVERAGRIPPSMVVPMSDSPMMVAVATMRMMMVALRSVRVRRVAGVVAPVSDMLSPCCVAATVLADALRALLLLRSSSPTVGGTGVTAHQS